MEALEAWGKAAKAALLARPDNDESAADLRPKIWKLMESTKRVATPLLHASKALKAQGKAGGGALKSLEISLVKRSAAWRVALPSKGVLLKLHRIKSHTCDFIIAHGFFGLASEEGFEALHPLTARAMAPLQSMASATSRAHFQGSADMQLESTSESGANNQEASIAAASCCRCSFVHASVQAQRALMS